MNVINVVCSLKIRGVQCVFSVVNKDVLVN